MTAWARAWERWDAAPHSDLRARALVDAGAAVAECVPGFSMLDLDQAVMAERRSTRLPVAHCIKLVLARALKNDEYEQWLG